MLKQVKKGETIARTAKVEGDTVWFNHLTKHRPSGVHYALRTGFDFANVPRAAILRLAGETLLIRWRTAIKDAEKVDDIVDNQLNSVVKMLTARKPRMSKAEQASALAKELSPDAKRALLKQLMAEIEPEGDEEIQDELDDEELDDETETEDQE